MKKVISCFLILFVGITFLDCNYDSGKEAQVLNNSVTKKSVIKNDKLSYDDSTLIFTNMEQIEYCLPLPLNEYTEDYDKSDVKAKHVFKHKTKKDNEITVQGMFRDDPSVSIEDYFKNSYQDSEEQGEIVEKKELFKDKNCFYAKGYMSNLIDKYKFIEVVWLRKDEVVVYSSTYDIADTTLWDEQLRILLNSPANCN